MFIRISKLAKDLGITKVTLYNWHKQGRVEFVKPYDNNFNFVTQEEYNRLLGIKEDKEQKVIIYTRVSSTANKSNLENQLRRLVDYCNAKGYKVVKAIKEFGSGINDKRPQLEKLLQNLDFTLLVVEHKDRLTRFGFNYLDLFLKSHNKKIEIVNNVDTDEEDLIQDFVSIITSYCARIYGKRRSKRKTERLIKELQDND